MTGRTMEAVDNPSYFTVPGDGKFSLLRRRGLGLRAGSPPSPVSPTYSFPTRRHSHSRTLLRSVSSQSDASLLVLGNPRLCDLAPTHRPSASATDLPPAQDEGEVFLYPDGDARYYNLTATKREGPRRRHSFGEFMRPSTSTSSATAVTPSTSAEQSTCHSSRKRCEKCSEKVTSKCSDLLDIVILSSRASEAASLWVNYLTTCFQQVAKERSRPPFKLLSIKVEDVLSGTTMLSKQDAIFKARLQVVILCPVFLECVSTSLSPATSLGSLLQPGHVLAMLLGVTDDAVTLQHRAAMVCYEKWQRQIVKDQDPLFVGDFLGTAMDILSRSWQLQQAINQIHKDENKAQFSVIPKKIKVGQNKLMIILIDPLEASDTVDISIDKNGERIEVPSFKKRNPYTLQFLVPASCMQVSMLVTVVVEKNGKPLGHRLIKCESRMRELDQLLRSSDNPLQFMCQTLGLSPSDREQLDVFLTAAFQQNLPPHFNLLRPTGLRHHAGREEYPTLLHFAARYGLEKLCWQLLECPGGEQASQIRNSCQLTPSDMAERAGHARLANTLKGFLQMTELSSMYSYLKGMSEKEANDLVTNFNCTNYLLPRPLNNTYSVPPAARPVINTPPPTTSTLDSPLSHPLHQYTNISSYQVPPSPVSVADNFDYNVPGFPLAFHSPLDNYQVPGQAIPYNPPTPPTPSSPLEATSPCGYIDMHSPTSTLNGLGSANKLRRKMVLNLPHHEYHNCPSDPQESFFHSADDILSCQQSYTHQRNSSHSSNSGKSSIVSAQDELAEIINDFKNNVFTITEVEKLVESWQNRHDVQQSFKDKQKQLNEMREEYEKIQKTMKEKLKRPTPFEKIRKFFSRGKNKNCSSECNTKPGQNSSKACANVNRRPPSSLSLHSSCSTTSSGRMSTGSGTSLGDSGTHSDTEDKRTSEINKNEILHKAHGKLCTDIPQRGPSFFEDNQETIKIGESYSLMTGSVKPDYLHRSNSLIQENTIEEEEVEYQRGLVNLPGLSKAPEVTEETANCLTNGNKTECLSTLEETNGEEDENDQTKTLPHPPNTLELSDKEETKYECVPKPNEEASLSINHLIIIEEGDDHSTSTNLETVNSENCSPDSSQVDNTSQSELYLEKTHSNESNTLESPKGFVKNIVNIIENEHSLNSSFDEAEEICDQILEEAETELHNYVNVTMIPSPSFSDDVTT